MAKYYKGILGYYNGVLYSGYSYMIGHYSDSFDKAFADELYHFLYIREPGQKRDDFLKFSDYLFTVKKGITKVTDQEIIEC